MNEPDIRLKRAQEAADKADGYRVLVDRLWPRGQSREKLALNEWCKEIAPSDDLRRWFGHDPARWNEFKKRYRTELCGQGERMDELLAKARPRLTLVYGAKDTEHNQAIVLRARLLERFRKRRANT